MPRRMVALIVGGLAMAGCRPDTVSLGFRPEVGDAFRYRYEIDLVVTSSVDGGAPEVTESITSLTSAQEVLDVTSEGVLVEVTVRVEGSAPVTTTVTLDRAGSLQAVDALSGLPVDGADLPTVVPPERPLRPGDRWAIDADGLTGAGRLARLGIVEGSDVAVVTTDVVQALDEAMVTSDSGVALEGELRSSTSTTFDLRDGAIRSGRTTSTGSVDLEIAPPPGIGGPPAPGTISYELRVRTVRLD